MNKDVVEYAQICDQIDAIPMQLAKARTQRMTRDLRSHPLR